MIGAVSPRTTTELVGRQDEVHRVLDALAWNDGGAGAVLLGGDAGIGKTALVGHVARLGADRRTLVGHCVGEGGTSLPYLPFVEMFAALDARERDVVDDLVGEHPGLVPLVPRVASGARGDAVRADLVEAVHGALADLGRRGPLLVVVEDVHWADESTRELLTLLFTRGLPDGVALLATYRSDDVHRRHPLAGALAVYGIDSRRKRSLARSGSANRTRETAVSCAASMSAASSREWSACALMSTSKGARTETKYPYTRFMTALSRSMKSASETQPRARASSPPGPDRRAPSGYPMCSS